MSRELDVLKRDLENARKKSAEVKAELTLLQKKLKEEFDLNSISDAETEINRISLLIEEQEEKKKMLLKKTNTLLEKFNSSGLS